jgi:uncharacterized BrkB/YihY/UPF0761 family membrane protein
VVSGGLGGWPLKIVGYLVAIALNFGLFLASFHFLCEEPPDGGELMPGAALAAILWTILQSLGGIYIKHIGKTDSTYGTFALVLGILTWLHLGTQMTLYCAEFNTVLSGKRWPRSLFDAHDDQPDQARPLGGLTVGEVSE